MVVDIISRIYYVFWAAQLARVRSSAGNYLNWVSILPRCTPYGVQPCLLNPYRDHGTNAVYTCRPVGIASLQCF